MSAVPLDEVLKHLNITDSTQTAELAGILDAAEAVIAQSVGPLEPQDPVTATLVGASSLVIPGGPVAVSSLTLDGVAVDPSLYAADTAAGVIWFLDGRTWLGSYAVTWTPGWTTLPADIELAVKEMVRHLWSSQRGGAQRPGSQQQGPQPGYLLPYLVEQLIEPYRFIGVGAA